MNDLHIDVSTYQRINASCLTPSHVDARYADKIRSFVVDVGNIRQILVE